MILSPDGLPALPNSTTSSALDHEHRRLMDEHHRRVDFSRSTAMSLEPSLRAALGALWRDRAQAEHRSVGIFATYTLDLMAAGAPARFLSLACRAQLDEVRHAEIFTALARCYTGADEPPPPGIAPVPDDPSLSLRELAAVEALHMCVGAESFSTALLHGLYEHATDPVVREVLAVVLSDEIHHARMGWAYLSFALREDPALRETIQRELIPVFDGLARGLFGPWGAPPPEDPFAPHELALARAHGHMPWAQQRVLFSELVEQVWLPSLPSLGLDPAGLASRFGR